MSDIDLNAVLNTGIHTVMILLAISEPKKAVKVCLVACLCFAIFYAVVWVKSNHFPIESPKVSSENKSETADVQMPTVRPTPKVKATSKPVRKDKNEVGQKVRRIDEARWATVTDETATLTH